MKRLTISLFLISFILFGFTDCKKNKENEATPEFDKGAMLTNIADNLILPAYANFYESIVELETKFNQFENDRSSQNLDLVQNSWKNAYSAWQEVKMYNFGPAMSFGLKSAIGTFPTDKTKIDNNITNGSYDLTSVSNIDAIGLPSLDYLLFESNALTNLMGNEAYVTYVYNVIQKMKSEAIAVKNAWTSYRATFVAATGNESTSAFSLLVNEFCKDYEEAKNAKIGIPLGKQSLGVQLPEYIEAKYSAFSFSLLKNNLHTLNSLFQGSSLQGTSGSGFDDYLIALDKTSLSSTITTNFSNIIAKIDTFSGSLEEEMISNQAALDELYQLLSNQVVYLKTDMSSAFGILITYQDNDGD